VNSELEAELAAFDGTASVWFGPIGGPARFARLEDHPHYSASTMKTGVMIAAFRAFADLDRPMLVHNEHTSAQPGAPKFGNDRAEDGDEAVWERLGEQASLRWLITRMIVRSSNLATNLVLAETGTAAVNQVWRDAGATVAHTGRGIEDAAARIAGISNEVTAADLSALMSALAEGRLAGPEQTQEMLAVLCAQEYLDDFSHGLPAGTKMAFKNGWVTGARHSTAIIYPEDSKPYVLSACTTGESSDEEACALLARIAKASWEKRT
jgi:beta-lactamase class A